MPKLIIRLIGKRKMNEDLAQLPVVHTLESHGVIFPLPIILVANILIQNIGLFELSTYKYQKNIDIALLHGLQGNAYKTWEYENNLLWL